MNAELCLTVAMLDFVFVMKNFWLKEIEQVVKKGAVMVSNDDILC